MTLRLAILAAGASERLGQCKALAPIGTTTPLAHLLESGSAAGDPRPLVVSGADFEAIRAAAPAHCDVAFNPAWRGGRTSGIALAHALRPGADLLLAPVDVPLVPREVFEALARAWLAACSPPRGWLAPRVQLRGAAHFGHPVVVGSALLDELDPSAPLRALRGHAEPLLALEVASARVLDDLDTPEDLARLRRLFRAP